MGGNWQPWNILYGLKHPGWWLTGMVKDEKSGESTPAAPSPEQSLAAAQKAADDKRRTILASGGQTDLTQGLAALSGSSVQKKTLLGS